MLKKLFPVEKWKSEHHYWILRIWINQGTNLRLNWQFWFFGPNLLQKSIWLKIGKSEQLMNSPYSKFLVPSFSFKDKASASRVKFAPKRCFQSKIEKVNSTTELHIFKLVLVPNFSLNRQFSFFWTNLPKKVFSVKNWKSEHH